MNTDENNNSLSSSSIICWLVSAVVSAFIGTKLTGDGFNIETVPAILISLSIFLILGWALRKIFCANAFEDKITEVAAVSDSKVAKSTVVVKSSPTAKTKTAAKKSAVKPQTVAKSAPAAKTKTAAKKPAEAKKVAVKSKTVAKSAPAAKTKTAAKKPVVSKLKTVAKSAPATKTKDAAKKPAVAKKNKK